MKIFVFIGFAFLGIATHTVAATYSDEACENYQKIASEFIDMELSGLRWEGTNNPECLVNIKPELTLVDRIPASDPSLLDPEYLLFDRRKVDFSVRRLPDEVLEVVMNYIGTKNQKDIAVKDKFLLKLNYGKTRELRGCASWLLEPEHFTMRKKCWRD